MKNLLIVGNSAFAEIAFEYFTHDSPYEVVAFSVESAYLNSDTFCGLPVVDFASVESLYSPLTHDVFVAVTYTQLNRLRLRLSSQAKNKGYNLASYISSKAFVWSNVSIDEHCFIFEGNIIQPFVTIGKNVVLWSGNHIGHHSKIADNCFISSHVVISGFCAIGEFSFIGVNSSIANNISIGPDNWLGPASLVTSDTPPRALLKNRSSELSKVDTYRFFQIK